jgi:hypothetical protein
MKTLNVLLITTFSCCILVSQVINKSLLPAIANRNKIYWSKYDEIVRKKQKELQRQNAIDQMLRDKQEEVSRNIIKTFLLQYGKDVLMDFYSGRY